jgi:hypothetical protein
MSLTMSKKRFGSCSDKVALHLDFVAVVLPFAAGNMGSHLDSTVGKGTVLGIVAF